MCSKERFADYRDNGFLVVPAIAINQAEMFYQELADLIRCKAYDLCSRTPGVTEDPTICHSVMKKIIHGYPAVLHIIYETLKCSSAIGRIVYDSSILAIAASLLELNKDGNLHDPLYLGHHTCRIREPNDSPFNHRWHQESFYSVYGASQVNLWMPLVERSSKSMGTISVLKKSHRDGELLHRLETKPDGKDQFYIPTESFDVSQYKETHIELYPGDALFFHPFLIHRGNPNTSDLARYYLTAAYVDATDLKFRLTSPEEQKDWHRQRCQKP